MKKILDTLYDTGIIILMVIYAILIYPYLLWKGVNRIILLKKKAKGIDLALRVS